ncbi:DUF2089 family protein [Lactobacillus bombi]|nr:DUF2089 family protein [Bombilactobacillus bombi]
MDNLTSDEETFVKNLVLNSGSLKKLQREYKVSYPTIRHKLDTIIAKVREVSDHKSDFNQKLMQLVIDEDISFDAANRIMQMYKEEIHV